MSRQSQQLSNKRALVTEEVIRDFEIIGVKLQPVSFNSNGIKELTFQSFKEKIYGINHYLRGLDYTTADELTGSHVKYIHAFHFTINIEIIGGTYAESF